MKNITFIEPASGISPEERDTLRKQLHINLPEKAPSTVPYCAGDETARYDELMAALHQEKPYIWALRGGYGSLKLFHALASTPKPPREKIIIGYSDITFLHLFLGQKWGWHTIHGAMPIEILNKKKNNDNFSILLDILEKEKGTVTYKNLIPLNQAAKNAHTIDAVLIGGNLTIISHSLGTPWQLNAANKILFLEDNNNKGYALDRYFIHLEQSGALKDIKAILLGTLMHTDEHGDYAVHDFVKNTSIPCYSANFIGHGDNNYPLPLGFATQIASNTEHDNYSLSIDYDFTT